MPFRPDPDHFLMHVADMLCTADASGYLTWVNPRWQEVLGWTPQELMAQPYLEFVHPDDVDRTARGAAAIAASGPHQGTFRNRYRTRDGGYRWLEWSTRVGPEGVWYCNVRDVTEQVEQRLLLEERTRLLEERSRLLEMSEALAKVGSWRVQRGGEQVTWSDEVYRIHGFEPGSFTPSVADAVGFYHPDDREHVTAAVQRTVDHAEPFRFEKRLVQPDGSVRFVACIGRPTLDAQGGVDGVVGVFHDVTDRALREQQLEEQVLSAQAAARSKAEFLANMSHEIRTPLNAILGMNELLAGTELTAAQREMTETVHVAGESLLRLIDDILDLAKLEAGRVVIEALPVEPAAVARQVRALFHGKALDKALSLEVDTSGLQHPWVSTDPTRLTQVLGNLVSNAIKFTEHGSVRVEVRSQASAPGRARLTLTVRDTGIGIPSDKQAQVFQAFAQADGSTTRRFGGTGLGLSISRSLVEAMGGEIELDSTEGSGSTFRILLDVPVAEAPDRAVPAATEHGELFGRRVLVVEDNPVNQRVVSLMLSRLGCEALLAEDGEQGLALWQEHRPDAVLMDVQMPGLDGYETTRRLRALEADLDAARTPVLGLTAHAMAPDVRACLDSGMDEHLSKPISVQRLAEALGRVVGSATAA